MLSRSCIGFVILFSVFHLQAQSTTPQWQVIAGTNLAFEVASLRPASPDSKATTNLDLDPSDYFRYAGGSIIASGQLIDYLIFAYKIQDRSQAEFIYKQLPAWTHQRYTLRATAESKSTKDQLRLMVQSLLADRFHLKLHDETRERPIYALVIDHYPAPGLIPEPDDSLCARPLDQPKPPTGSTALPRSCQLVITNKGDLRQARMMDYTLNQIAGNLVLASLGALDARPVLNKTALNGNYDMDIVFLPPKTHIDTLTPDVSSEVPGANFEDALQQQAGLRLLKQTGAVPVYIIDHLEPPTEN